MLAAAAVATKARQSARLARKVVEMIEERERAALEEDDEECILRFAWLGTLAAFFKQTIGFHYV